MSFGVLLDGGLGLLIWLCLITLLCVGLIDCDYSVCLMLLVGTYCWLSGWLVVLVVAFCCCGLGICLWWVLVHWLCVLFGLRQLVFRWGWYWLPGGWFGFADYDGCGGFLFGWLV